MKIFAATLSLIGFIAFGLAPLHASMPVTQHLNDHGSATQHSHGSSDILNKCEKEKCGHEAIGCCDVGPNHCGGATLSQKKPDSAPYRSLSIAYIDLIEYAGTVPRGIEPPPPRL